MTRFRTGDRVIAKSLATHPQRGKVLAVWWTREGTEITIQSRDGAHRRSAHYYRKARDHAADN